MGRSHPTNPRLARQPRGVASGQNRVRMPALMRYRFALLVFQVAVLAVLAALGACGKEIGDGCVLGTDCDPNGERLCDPASVGGYCTIQGCDLDTCPGESACIRFFTGSFENRVCD